MKKLYISFFLIGLFFVCLTGCKDHSNDLVTDSPKGSISDDKVFNEVEGTENNAQIDSIVGSNTNDAMYQSSYAIISYNSLWTSVCVEQGKVKNIEFSKVTDDIYSQGDSYRVDFEWGYYNGKLQLGMSNDNFERTKIPNYEDRVLMKCEPVDAHPFYRIFDATTREILTIYPNSIEEDYFILDVVVTSDLSNIILLTDKGLFWYDGTEIKKIIAEYDEKFAILHSPKVLLSEGQVLVTGYDSDWGNLCCYIYDWNTSKIVERVYHSHLANDEGVKTYSENGERRYGTTVKNGKLCIVDLLTGREDETDILREKVSYIGSISEEWFFVLADYGYFIEKSTGRMIAKTEKEIELGPEEKIYVVDLVPSDEDLYFCIRIYGDEDSLIYKIELDE